MDVDYKAYFIGLCHTWMTWHDGTISLNGPKSRLDLQEIVQ